MTSTRTAVPRAASRLARAHIVLLFVLFALPPLTTLAAPWPRVAAIRFTGNDTTRESVLRREMTIAPGDPADPAELANSRQAILDLGLFRSVDLSTEPAEGGVVVVVAVDEKWYVLPIPRADASSDGDYGYGVQLRWSNVLGRNHTLNAYAEQSEYEEERDREDERRLRVSYAAPYVFGSRYELRSRLEYLERGALDPQQRPYDETFRRAELLAVRDFTTDRPRRGWVFGAGLYYDDQTTGGAFAPPPDGEALAAVATARWDDLRFHVYSETGRRFDVRTELASSGAVSDYGYTRTTARGFESRAIGGREHQTLHLLASGGVVTGGPRSRNNFSLGGSGRLRGYETDFVEGDRYYYVAAEYLRPIRWDWLRLLVLAEVGGARRNVFGTATADGSPYASIGLGLRLRFVRFVDVEIELGVAYPLRGGDGARFFAGGN